MEKCYVVMRTRFSPEDKHYETNILRVYKELDSAALYVATMTGKKKNEIVNTYNDGQIDIKFCNWIYSIIENILE